MPPFTVLWTIYFYFIQICAELGWSLISHFLNRESQMNNSSQMKGGDSTPMGQFDWKVNILVQQCESALWENSCNSIAVQRCLQFSVIILVSGTGTQWFFLIVCFKSISYSCSSIQRHNSVRWVIQAQETNCIKQKTDGQTHDSPVMSCNWAT